MSEIEDELRDIFAIYQTDEDRIKALARWANRSIARMAAAAEPETARLLPLIEVARLLNIPANTLRYWRQRNEGPPSVRLGRRVFYDPLEVSAWIRRNEENQ